MLQSHCIFEPYVLSVIIKYDTPAEEFLLYTRLLRNIFDFKLFSLKLVIFKN